MDKYTKRRLEKAFEKLSDREIDIYKMTEGIFEYDRKHKSKEVGEKYDISGARVIQINKVTRRVLVTIYGVDTLKLGKS